MTEEESGAAKAVSIVTDLVKAVPVYQDLVQPAAQELGKNLATMAKAVSIALAPLSMLVWGYDKIRDFVETRVAEKLEGVPADQIRPPSPHVAGPALEALRYTGHEEALRELYANLLASSIDASTARSAHPGFVDIIKNMAPDEALIMRFLATNSDQPLIDVRRYSREEEGFRTILRDFSLLGGRAACKHPELTSSYVDNLRRLGLVDVAADLHLTNSKEYEDIEATSQILMVKEQAANAEARIEVVKKLMHLTTLGRQFCKTCVVDKRVQSVAPI